MRLDVRRLFKDFWDVLYRDRWTCTPVGTDLAESMQVLQIEPSSTSLRQEMKTIRHELKSLSQAIQSLVKRVEVLEYEAIPEDTLICGH